MDRNILHIAELLKEGVGDEARVPQLPEVSKRVGERRKLIGIKARELCKVTASLTKQRDCSIGEVM